MKASTKLDPFYPPRLGQTCPMSYSLLQGSTESQKAPCKMVRAIESWPNGEIHCRGNCIGNRGLWRVSCLLRQRMEQRRNPGRWAAYIIHWKGRESGKVRTTDALSSLGRQSGLGLPAKISLSHLPVWDTHCHFLCEKAEHSELTRLKINKESQR